MTKSLGRIICRSGDGLLTECGSHFERSGMDMWYLGLKGSILDGTNSGCVLGRWICGMGESVIVILGDAVSI